MTVRSAARRAAVLPVALATLAIAGLPGPSYALPILTDSTGTLNFGDVLIGKSKSLGETISNTGTANSTLTGIEKLQNDTQGEFGGTATVNLSLTTTNTKTPASKTTNYTYAPINLGTDSGSLNISTNGSNNGGQATVQLTGTGVAPVEQIGETNAPYTLVGKTGNGSVTVTNVGDGNLSGLGATSNLSGSVASVNSGGLNLTGGAVSLGDGKSQTFGYSFKPTARGAVTATTTETFTDGSSAGNNAAQKVTTTIGGQGVAPLTQVTQSNAGNIRIGTTGTASITVANGGDGNLSGLGAISNLNGSVGGSAGAFSGAGGTVSLTDNSSTTFNYNFTPTTHGAANSPPIAVAMTDGNANGTNAPQSEQVTLTGTGVGPVLASSQLGKTLELSGEGNNGVPLFANYNGGTMVNFGTVDLGKQNMRSITISNATTDPKGNPALTGLSVLGGNFAGPGANAFSIGDSIAEILGPNAKDTIDLLFKPTQIGFFDAIFNLSTDEDAAFGSVGDIYTVRVSGRAIVPEPMSLSLLGISILMAGAARRRARRQA
jgi:hypothetical protein